LAIVCCQKASKAVSVCSEVCFSTPTANGSRENRHNLSDQHYCLELLAGFEEVAAARGKK
jgi:hypothetical protein